MKNNTNILTGFNDLDAAIGGFKRGDLIVLASRPSQGKTALALNIVYNVAVRRGFPVALFSLETDGIFLLKRMACAAAKIDIRRISIDMFQKEQGKALNLELEKIGKSNLFICDKPSLSVKEIKNYIEKLIKQDKKPELIVIDYFDLIKRGKKQDIVVNMRTLKEIAVKFDVSVLVCSQMCRQNKGEHNRPELSHLRYPQFADIADLILLLHREYYYTKDESQKNTAEILIETPIQKEIGLKWSPKYCSFRNIEEPMCKKEIEGILRKHWHPTRYLDRQRYNLEILEELKNFLKQHPDIRFIQSLWALNIVDKEDRFYEEPELTLAKVKESKVHK